MATLLFLLCDGAVISLLEDQIAALFMGATVAQLLSLPRPATRIAAVAGLV